MRGLGAILLGDCHFLEHSNFRNCLGDSVSQLLAELAKGVLAGSSVLRAAQREQTGAIASPVEMGNMATGMVGSLLAGHTAELTYGTAARGELVHVVQEGLEGVLVLGVLLHCFSLFQGVLGLFLSNQSCILSLFTPRCQPATRPRKTPGK